MEATTHHIFDKRVQKPIVYRVGDLGEDVTMQETLNYKVGKCHLRFYKPNATAIFLSSSEKELTQAKKIYNALIINKITKRDQFNLSDDDTVLLYDYMEHIQSAIVMAFTAVECLINELVPGDFIYRKKLKDGRIEELNRKDIERWMSTIDKITLVIPSALNINNPTTYNFWPKFTKLKDLRNDIIHSRSILPIEIEENQRIFSLLLNDSVFGKIKSASELINKIHSELPPHQVMPILKETENIEPINISTWESSGFKKIN